jgi:hypothetical protein
VIFFLTKEKLNQWTATDAGHHERSFVMVSSSASDTCGDAHFISFTFLFEQNTTSTEKKQPQIPSGLFFEFFSVIAES